MKLLSVKGRQRYCTLQVLPLPIPQVQVKEAVNFSVKAIETAVAPLEELTAEEVKRLEVGMQAGLARAVFIFTKRDCIIGDYPAKITVYHTYMYSPPQK